MYSNKYISTLKNEMSSSSNTQLKEIQNKILGIHFVTILIKTIKQAIYLFIFIFFLFPILRALEINLWLFIAVLLIIQLGIEPLIRKCLR